MIAQSLAQMTKKPSTIIICKRNSDSIHVPPVCVVASLILITRVLVIIAQKSARILGWLFNRTRLVPRGYVLGNMIRIPATTSMRGTIILTKASAPINSSQIMVQR